MAFDPTEYLKGGPAVAEPAAPAFDVDSFLKSDPAAISQSYESDIAAKAEDPAFDPVSHAMYKAPDSPDAELAARVAATRAKTDSNVGGPSSLDKLKGAGMGLVNMFTGTVGNATAAVGANVTAPLIGGIADYAQRHNFKLPGLDAIGGEAMGDPDFWKAQADKYRTMGMAQAQSAGEGFKAFNEGIFGTPAEHQYQRDILDLHNKTVPGMKFATPEEKQQFIESETEKISYRDFKRGFLDKVGGSQRAHELAQGKVQETGPVADAYKSMVDTVADVMLLHGEQPELKAETTPTSVVADFPEQNLSPAEQYLTEAGGEAANPAMLAYGAIPNIAPALGGVVRAGGGIMEAAGNKLALVKKFKAASPMTKTLITAAGGSAVTVGAIEGAHVVRELANHPQYVAGALALGVMAAALPKAGRLAQLTGTLMEGGLPAEGTGALQIGAAKAAGQIGTGAALGAGINAAQGGHDLEQGAYSGGVFGLMGAFGGVRGIQEASTLKAAAQRGRELRTGNPYEKTHDAIIASLPPQYADEIAARRATAFDGGGTDTVLVDQNSFSQIVKERGGAQAEQARGLFEPHDPFAVSADGKTIYLNADAIGKTATEKGGATADTFGHEYGHAIVDFLNRAGRTEDAKRLFDSVKTGLTGPEFDAFRQQYRQALVDSGATPEQAEKQTPDKTLSEEQIAEVTRDILSGKSIAEFAYPKPIKERLVEIAKGAFGIKAPAGDLNFGAKQIADTAKQVDTLLREQGQKAFDARQRARDVAAGKAEPTITERLGQIETKVADLEGRIRDASANPDKATAKDFQTWQAERAKLLAEAAKLSQTEAEKTGAPKAPLAEAPTAGGATAPVAVPANTPVSQTHMDAIAALKAIKREDAANLVPTIEGANADEIVAKAVEAANKARNAPSVASAAPLAGISPEIGQSTAPAPKTSLAGVTAELAPAPESKSSLLAKMLPEPQPDESTNPQAKTNLAGVTPVVPDVPKAGRATPAIPTPQAVQDALGAADKATVGQKPEKVAKARQEALRAQLPAWDARSAPPGETAPEDLHTHTDEYGKTSVRGLIDESNPLHEAFLKEAAADPATRKNMADMQSRRQKVAYIDYGAAKVHEGQEHSAEQRAAELADSEAGARMAGGETTEQLNKAVIPLGTKITNTGKVALVVYSPDKLHANALVVVRAANDAGFAHGYEGSEAEINAALSRDLETATQNHANGFSMDGQTDLTGAGRKGNPFRDAAGKFIDAETAKQRQDVLNMAANDTGITESAKYAQKLARYEKAMAEWEKTKEGRKPRKPAALSDRAQVEEQKALGLNAAFEGYRNPETGEANKLRDALGTAGFDAATQLESPVETLRPELIRAVRDEPQGDRSIVRAQGEPAGRPPKSDYVRGGFMPKTDALGFYSGLRETAEEKIPNRASAKQILATLDPAKGGVKKEELEWLGLPQWLEGKENVTKQELLDFIDANAVQLKEVVKGGNGPNPTARIAELEARREEGDDLSTDELYELNRLYREDEAPAGHGSDTATKFSQYTLPGGTNYKETLLTVPQNKATAEELQERETLRKKKDLTPTELERLAFLNGRALGGAHEPNQFRSSHWDEPNVLAHTRQADHVDTEGNKVRLIEEIQSDWHQEGRKKGYQSDESKGEFAKQKARVTEIENRLNQLIREKSESVNLRTYEGIIANDLYKENSEYKSLRDELDTLPSYSVKTPSGVPDAPFKKSWMELAFKNALKNAVADNMDVIAWVPGEAQAARYDLSKSISKIVSDSSDGKNFALTVYDPSGKRIISQTYKAEKLPDVVGKEIAERIVKETPVNKAPESDENLTLEGLDLKVGGEGMKAFYDKILPDFVRKYVKRWGGTIRETVLETGVDDPDVGEVAKDNGMTEREFYSLPESQQDGLIRAARGNETTVQSVKITPEMRKAVTEGQPLFMPRTEDTGKPGESGDKREDLAREAEAAGVVLSKDMLKGIMGEDPKVMQQVRERIEKETGSPAKFMPRDETDSEKKDREATERAERYFEIGQGDDEAMAENDNWIYDAANRTIKSKQGGTHGANWSHDVADRTFKGWYDRETDTISVAFPATELRKIEGDPTVDDIPTSVETALRRKFGKTAKLVPFMPKADSTAKPTSSLIAKISPQAPNIPDDRKTRLRNIDLAIPAPSPRKSLSGVIPELPLAKPNRRVTLAGVKP